MKILIDHPAPFFLAHGGIQKQIEETKRALEQRGVEVEYVRWWDDRQTGSLIHSFGIPSRQYLELAHRNNLPVIVTSVFSATCNRSDGALKRQGATVRFLTRIPGWGSVKRQLNWESYPRVDCNIVGLSAEKDVLRFVYGVPEEKIRIVPLGLTAEFHNVVPSNEKADYLITTGTITPAKGSLDLAKLARSAQVPVLFVGKPIHDEDSYWHEFRSLIDEQFVRYHAHVDDVAVLIDLLRRARGFVLYSEYENWSLAAHEAAACGLPLLLPDLKWSRERFGEGASYFEKTAGRRVRNLTKFYEQAGELHPPKINIYSWDDVATKLIEVYRQFGH